MLKFTSIEKFQIPGCGLICVVALDKDYASFKELINAKVQIDGENFTITGVECFAKSGIHRAGTKIGLLVTHD